MNLRDGLAVLADDDDLALRDLFQIAGQVRPGLLNVNLNLDATAVGLSRAWLIQTITERPGLSTLE